MILDNGICSIYRVDRARGTESPVSGLTPHYENWYGSLRGNSGGGSEPGDIVKRIRIHGCDVQTNDIVAAEDRYWLVTRAYHGTDDDNGQPIVDLTIERGTRHFVRIGMQRVEEEIVRGKIAREDGAIDETFGHIGTIDESEFYNSQQAGYDLEFNVTLWAMEYNGAAALIVNGQRYRVVRKTHNVSAGLVVLACERVRGRM